MMKHLIALMRPKQWLKNLFVLLPLFFSGRMMDVLCWNKVVWAAIAYSLAASSIYVLNDLIDAEADRRHPEKCKRPIASGCVKGRQALWLAAICMVLALAVMGLLVNMQSMAVIAVYCVLNIGYCLKLKQIAVLDILIVSSGYVLRLLVGSYATGVVLSQWIVLMTFLLALFLALAKRRDDVLIYENDGIQTRGTVLQYNLPFINASMSVMAAVMVVCYLMYTVSPEVTQRLHTSHLYLTSLFVIAGVLRYMQIAFVSQQSGSPTRVLSHDVFIQLCVLGWVLTFAAIIYC